MSDHYYIGVDGGGTSTRALFADHEGRILGSGIAGSANRNHHTRDEAQANLCLAVRDALSGFKPDASQLTVFLGMSGVSTDADRLEIEAIAREIPEIGREARVAVDNDSVAGLTGGLAGQAGIVLIAGTGSACLGINERGERWFCGGWGALADDAGSAPWIGLQALHAAVRAEDGRMPPTLLHDIVFRYLDLIVPRQLISRIHNPDLDRAELGGLAPHVIEACENGDAAAGAILNQAAAELSGMVSATVRKLFGASPCDLILVGGLALSGPPFQPLLTDRLCGDIPTLRLRTPVLTPVQGAVLEALRAGGVPWTETVLANLARPTGDATICRP